MNRRAMKGDRMQAIRTFASAYALTVVLAQALTLIIAKDFVVIEASLPVVAAVSVYALVINVLDDWLPKAAE